MCLPGSVLTDNHIQGWRKIKRSLLENGKVLQNKPI